MEISPKRIRSTLRTYSDFKRVFNEGRRFFRDGLGFYFRKGDGLHFRYGMSVPKRFGNAVQRNKLRRRLREIIRLMPTVPESAEVVVSVYKPCENMTYKKAEQLLEWAFVKIAKGKNSKNDEHGTRGT